jgi:TrmH family RNA methyltransferase
MGSILRTCWGLGVGAVLLTKGCVDPFSPKVIRATMGALINVPVFSDVSIEQLDSLKENGFDFICTDVHGGIRYCDASYIKPAVIIMGSEAQGVDPEIKNWCGQNINIPLKSGVDSLNVAAACAIILAEAWRQHLSVPGENQ